MQISATVERQSSVVYRNSEPNNFMRQDMQMMVLGKFCRKIIYGYSAFSTNVCDHLGVLVRTGWRWLWTPGLMDCGKRSKKL